MRLEIIYTEDINYTLGAGVIVFDKARGKLAEDTSYIAAGDYYFDYLNSKVKLSELGIQVLEYLSKTALHLLPAVLLRYASCLYVWKVLPCSQKWSCSKDIARLWAYRSLVLTHQLYAHLQQQLSAR